MNDFELVKGIGPKVKEYLEKLDIFNMEDLLSHYPFRYEVLKKSNINELKDEDKIIIDGVVESIPTLIRFKGNMNKMTFNINTGEMILKATIYNRGFLKNNITIGKIVTLIGKYEKSKNHVVVSDILFQGLSNKPTIIPIYRTTSGLNRKALNTIIQNALSVSKNKIIDYIPEYLSDAYKFLDKYSSLLVIHNPTDIDLLKKAMIRLKYEELFMFMLKINYLKIKRKSNVISNSKNIDKKLILDIEKQLPFELTIDQKKSINEIIDDLNSDSRMNRLLQGDVGSGKTIVAFIASYCVIKSNYQVAFMVPTEILARQHYKNALKLFNDINIGLLVGSMTKKEKEKVYKDLEDKKIDFIIGTHALIQDEVRFNNLGMIITDEQHRFGVNQRSNLRSKGDILDVLYMSATPIPRTYALTIYGDMDISSIKTIPKDKKQIITYIKSQDEIIDVLSLIKKELELNHQIYVVAPLIEDIEEESNKDNVIKLTKRYEMAFKNYKIGMLHGKMKTKEKDAIMQDFIDNKINILISTTVIEVGVDVRNATVMVIHDALFFGLSTLHQLRGRVGRSDIQSYCVLVGPKDNERLKIMEKVYDGFELALEDFKLRGSGDIFGIRQSGDMQFKIANISKDYKILLKAKEDSLKFLENKLLNEYKEIKKELSRSINID